MLGNILCGYGPFISLDVRLNNFIIIVQTDGEYSGRQVESTYGLGPFKHCDHEFESWSEIECLPVVLCCVVLSG